MIDHLPEMLTAVFTAVIALATVWLARETVKAARMTVQANLCEHYIERWESIYMRQRRAHLAAKLAERLTLPNTAISERIIDDTLGIFDELGLFLKKKWVDDDFMWEIFSEYAFSYWYIFGEQYVRENPDYQFLYSNYVILIDRMAKISKKRKENLDIYKSPRVIREFLTYEQDLWFCQ